MKLKNSKKNTGAVQAPQANRSPRDHRPELAPTNASGGNMVIRVPMKFKRDRGRKQIIGPAGLDGPVVFNRGQDQQDSPLAQSRSSMAISPDKILDANSQCDLGAGALHR